MAVLLLVGFSCSPTRTIAETAPVPQAPNLAEYDDVPVQNVELTNAPFKGPGDAPIKVLEYADFLCPSCKNLAGALSHYLPRSGNRVAVYFKNYPLEQECNPSVARTIHAGACNLALGAICAQEQGRFWPYHDRVFASPPGSPRVEDVVKLGGEAGLDGPALQACLGSARAKETLAQQIAEAQRVAVTVTPTVLVNGKKLIRLSDFTQMIEKESTRLGLPSSPAPGQP